MRWVLAPAILLLLAVVVLWTAAAPASAASGEIVSVDHPEMVVFDRTYEVNVKVRNTGSEDLNATVHTVLYEPDDQACGSSRGDDYHGPISTRAPSLAIPPGGTLTYPTEVDPPPPPWFHRVNESNRVSESGTYEVCVFLQDRQAQDPIESFLDFHRFNVTLRLENGAPTGEVTVTPPEGTTETTFAFEATATDPEGDRVRYLWDMGDQDASGYVRLQGELVNHRFYPPGVFTVNLTLTDGWDESVVTTQVVVRPPDGANGGDDGLLPMPAGGGPVTLVPALLLALLLLGRGPGRPSRSRRGRRRPPRP